MVILKADIFTPFRDIQFGFSTKIGLNRKPPYHFNLSLSVGDDDNMVLENRKSFFSSVGLPYNRISFQKQVHGDKVSIIGEPGFAGESDAMITRRKGIGLAVSTGDCVPLFLYDKKNDVIAAIHSGWRSTEKRITEKTIARMKDEYQTNPVDVYVYIGPSINWNNYTVGKEVAALFEDRFIHRSNGTIFIDLVAANRAMLTENGIPGQNIQISHYCSYNFGNLLHSYRREGANSGRAYGVIAMKAQD